MITLSLIFPAYNEANTILNTLREAVTFLESKNISFEIIVSADGEDGTRELVAGLLDARIKAIGNRERGGKGRGVRLAVEKAQGQYIGYADADNKTPITELVKILPLLERGSPVVIGSRAIQGSDAGTKPIVRRLGSWGFRYVMQMVTGLRGVPDTQCGFKFFQKDTAKKLFSIQKTDGYMFDVELLILARKLGLTIEQVPVRWRDDGDSRLNMVRGNLRNLADLSKMRFNTTVN